MKIVHIQYPDVITDGGVKIPFSMIKGTPKIGSELKPLDELYEISAITEDNECVSGVCPVR